MSEPRDYDLVFAIIILTIVIAILGAPFAWNEYEKLIDSHKVVRNFHSVFGETDSAIEQEKITNVNTPIQIPIQSNFQSNNPPYIPIIQHKITDGYWCRDTTKNIGKDPTNVKECYQFFSDGTFKWGYAPGYPMGKSQSCWAPNVKCEYSLNPKGQYEVSGGYFYTLSGDSLVDPFDPPYFRWSSTGIP